MHPLMTRGDGSLRADLPADQRAETNFFSGEPLRALRTLVYSDNVDLQRSASLTFAEITERGIDVITSMTIAVRGSTGMPVG